MPWRDVITGMARHSNTSVDAVEDWDIDKLLDYMSSVSRVVKAENAPKSGRAK